jgi:hypothetical protein
MFSLRAALCSKKIGLQPASLTQEVGDWPDCAPNATTVIYSRDTKVIFVIRDITTVVLEVSGIF